MDNLTETESLEQDGVLIVNVSNDNIFNFDDLFPNILIINSTNKIDEVKNKIQSNSREITGDTNKNLSKFKENLENITVAPAPTNGVLSVDQDNDELNKDNINKYLKNIEVKDIELNLLSKPTESLQSFVKETPRKHRRRRRRHGNGRRYKFYVFQLF